MKPILPPLPQRAELPPIAPPPARPVLPPLPKPTLPPLPAVVDMYPKEWFGCSVSHIDPLPEHTTSQFAPGQAVEVDGDTYVMTAAGLQNPDDCETVPLLTAEHKAALLAQDPYYSEWQSTDTPPWQPGVYEIQIPFGEIVRLQADTVKRRWYYPGAEFACDFDSLHIVAVGWRGLTYEAYVKAAEACYA